MHSCATTRMMYGRSTTVRGTHLCKQPASRTRAVSIPVVARQTYQTHTLAVPLPPIRRRTCATAPTHHRNHHRITPTRRFYCIVFSFFFLFFFRKVHFTIAVKQQNIDELKQIALKVSDPRNEAYTNYLTNDEIVAMTAPDAKDVTTASKNLFSREP